MNRRAAALSVSLLLCIAAFADPLRPVQDNGFEQQTSRTISAPWTAEGSGGKGIDIGLGFAASGRNNAFIRTAGAHEWNAITQVVRVKPRTRYRVSANVRTSNNVRDGYFGARTVPGNQILKERRFAAMKSYTRLIFDVDSGDNDTLRIFIGYWAAGQDSWIQIDDVWAGGSVPID
jgi:hypothetical protein